MSPALHRVFLREVLTHRTSDPGLAALVESSIAEGFLFVERLEREWLSGENRFERPGEALFEAREDDALVGIGGLNRDPSAPYDVGRLRHLYVRPHWRRRGIGRELVGRVLSHARRHFRLVRLRTENPEANAFYEALGFTPVSSPSATHELAL